MIEGSLPWAEREERIPPELLDLLRDPARDPVPALLLLLEADDVDLREEALHYLSAILSPRAIPALIRRLQKDPDPCIRGDAAEALGSLRATAAISALLDSLADTDSYVRLCAAEALGFVGTGDTRVAPALCDLLTDPDSDVRIFVLEALGEIGDTNAIPEIRARRSQEAPMVRVWVDYALALLRDEPFALTETLTILRRGGGWARTQAAKVLARMATPQTAGRIARTFQTVISQERRFGVRECLEMYLYQIEADEREAGTTDRAAA